MTVYILVYKQKILFENILICHDMKTLGTKQVKQRKIIKIRQKSHIQKGKYSKRYYMIDDFQSVYQDLLI